MLDKLEYVARQLARAQRKPYEHYVVTRIWHTLNDITIKIVTQQFVTRLQGLNQAGAWAMTDMYFPQLGVHVEVDEEHHGKAAVTERDKVRDADIVDATGHEVVRIKVGCGIEELNRSIDSAVEYLRLKRQQAVGFVPWDMEREQDPMTYVEKGFLDAREDIAFRRIVDAAMCFGKASVQSQNAGF